MGKWCFSHIVFSERYENEEKRIKGLSDAEVKEEWLKIGSPSISDYGLEVFSGISGSGWCTIDNSTAPEQKTNPIQCWANREQYLRGDLAFEHHLHRACLLANRMGIQRRN